MIISAQKLTIMLTKSHNTTQNLLSARPEWMDGCKPAARQTEIWANENAGMGHVITIDKWRHRIEVSWSGLLIGQKRTLIWRRGLKRWEIWILVEYMRLNRSSQINT